MVQLIEVNDFPKPALSRYREFNSKQFEHLSASGSRMAGASILHINSTTNGGGVAELLRSQIHFERELGLRSRWFGLTAPKPFFRVTKKIHNLLQGEPGMLTESERLIYAKTNAALAKPLIRIIEVFKPDLVVFHDPQPLPLVQRVPKNIPSVLRLHIDLSAPSPTLAWLVSEMEKYRGIAVSSPRYARHFSKLSCPQAVIMPAIDPLAEKNLPIDDRVAAAVIAKFGMHPEKPLAVQVSRFDKWKDPLGVIRAYYRAKNKVPDLQLALAGFAVAQDDPEAAAVIRAVKKHAKSDPDIHLFTDPRTLKDISNDSFIAALYQTATVVVQKSIREGFGLTMTEAMWKGKAVVAGATEGAKLQITDGITGIIASTDKQVGAAIVQLIEQPTLRQRLGSKAKKSVRRNFLLPRYALENIRFYQLVTNKQRSRSDNASTRSKAHTRRK